MPQVVLDHRRAAEVIGFQERKYTLLFYSVHSCLRNSICVRRNKRHAHGVCSFLCDSDTLPLSYPSFRYSLTSFAYFLLIYACKRYESVPPGLFFHTENIALGCILGYEIHNSTTFYLHIPSFCYKQNQ